MHIGPYISFDQYLYLVVCQGVTFIIIKDVVFSDKLINTGLRRRCGHASGGHGEVVVQGESPVDGEEKESQCDQAKLQNVIFVTEQIAKSTFTRPLKFARSVTFCNSVTRLTAVMMTTLLYLSIGCTCPSLLWPVLQFEMGSTPILLSSHDLQPT